MIQIFLNGICFKLLNSYSLWNLYDNNNYCFMTIFTFQSGERRNYTVAFMKTYWMELECVWLGTNEFVIYIDVFFSIKQKGGILEIYCISIQTPTWYVWMNGKSVNNVKKQKQFMELNIPILYLWHDLCIDLTLVKIACVK
jgi:hypothetical protein